jgi:ligand-binding sensor domain-containing protein
VNRPYDARRDATSSFARLAAAAGVLAGALLTGAPLLHPLGPQAATARAADLSAPLPGGWRTFASGDRILRVRLAGDDLWSATDGGGAVRWTKATGVRRQYLAPQDGLASNVVNDIAVTADGTVWAATQAGLCRYDAATDAFRALTPANSTGMPSRVATALAATDDGKLWVGFGQEWDSDQIDPNSRTAGTFLPGGLALFDPATGSWGTAFHVVFGGTWNSPTFAYLTSENVSVLELATDGTLWIGTVPYYVWDANNCNDADCPDESGYWVPAGGGLAAKNGDAWQNWYPSQARSGACYSTIVRDLAADVDGRMWVASGDSLMLMRNGLALTGCDGQVRYEKARLKSVGLRGNMVWTVDVDADGHVWVGQGQSYDTGLGIGILDYNGTLDDFDAWDTDDFWEFIDLDALSGDTNTVVTALRIDADGRVIVGTRNHKDGDGDGLRIYDRQDASWTALRTSDDGLPSNHIADVGRNPVTGDLWVSTTNKGVARFDGQHWTHWRMFQAGAIGATTTVDARIGHTNIPTDIASREAYDRLFPTPSSWVRIGDDPTLYMVTGYTVASKAIRIAPGLTTAAPAGTPVYLVDRGPASDLSTQLAFGADGSVWVGGRETIWLGSCSSFPHCWLDGGVGKWDGVRWTVYNLDMTVTGLPDRDNEVGAVALDADGRVWMGTGNPFQGQDGRGIFVFDPVAPSWTLYRTVSVLSKYFGGDGIADFDLDNESGDMWVAHHSTEVCANNSPFGEGCEPAFTGGGLSRFDGTAWQKWTKRSGAFLKASGQDGDIAAVKVDHANDRIWAGGYETGSNFHWLQGIDVDAVINWCPLAACTNDAWKHQVWEDDGLVTAIEVDDLGNVWAGTHRYGNGTIPPLAGIKLFDGDTWRVYTPDNSGLPSNEITVLRAEGDGMWIGTRRDGLSLYERERPATATPVPSNTPDATFTASSTPVDEHTPTVRPGTGVATATGTARMSPTASRGTPGPPGTSVPDPCPQGGPCPLSLPMLIQHRTCKTNCIKASTPTATPRSVSATPTRTETSLPPTDTATLAVTPSATPTDAESSTPVPTRAVSATPSATSTPTFTATQGATSTATATTAVVRNWTTQTTTASRVAYNSVYGTDASHVWFAGEESNVWFWNGTTFARERDNFATGLTFRTIHMYSATRGYVVGDGTTTNPNGFYETRNGGELWRVSGSDTYVDNWYSVAVARATSGYVAWAVGNLNGNRLMWTGTDWAPQSPGDRNNRSHAYSDVAVLDETHAYAVSNASTGARLYTWNGTSWSPGPSTVALYDLHVLSPTQGVAVGRSGAVWRLTADGWARMADSPRTGGQDLYAVFMRSDNEIWAAGGRGKIFLWNGIDWTDASIGGQVKAIRSIWMTAAGNDGWAVGDDGLILRYQ